MASSDRDPRMEDGAQPVPDHPPEMPTAGRTAMQTLTVVISGLVVVAAVLYLVARLAGV